jgi:hypothetical protein
MKAADMNRQTWNTTFHEGNLPYNNTNYSMSPAAKRALVDGSLDPNQTHFCRISNRKLKMRDTFTKIMPTYNHGEPSALAETHSHW